MFSGVGGGHFMNNVWNNRESRKYRVRKEKVVLLVCFIFSI